MFELENLFLLKKLDQLGEFSNPTLKFRNSG